MTPFALLLWIAAALLVQLAVLGAMAFWRQWRAYQALRQRSASQGMAPDLPEGASSPPATQVPALAWAGYRNFRVEGKAQEDASAQVFSFYLTPQDNAPLPEFLPGQFLTFALDVPAAQGGTQALVRCYSLSDAPHPGHYRITVKRAVAPNGSAHPAGLASNYLHDQVEVGDFLRVRAPGGHFHLDSGDAPVVLIGGGIGITPMISMLNGCLQQQPGRELWLFYGVRQHAELVMSAHLQAMALQFPNLHLHLCLSDARAKPHADWGERRVDGAHYHPGRVDIALLRRLLPLKPYHFYVCGPTPMLQSLVPALQDWGVPEGRIHFEAFGPASIARKSAGQGATSRDGGGTALVVRFAKSNTQISWEPSMGTLLDLSQAHGVAVDSGCRAGSCGTCQTVILSGQVAYLQTPDFDPEPGTCLLCVCTPTTDVTLEA